MSRLISYYLERLMRICTEHCPINVPVILVLSQHHLLVPAIEKSKPGRERDCLYEIDRL